MKNDKKSASKTKPAILFNFSNIFCSSTEFHFMLIIPQIKVILDASQSYEAKSNLI
jgi:hypothetical protein